MRKKLLLLCFMCLCVLSQAQQSKLRVAVLDPTTSGAALDEGTKLAVQELISSALVNTGRFIIIERSMIDKIIKEQSFQNSDMADNSQATEIGKLAGANKIILSAVSMVGGRNMLSIKMIDVTTASIESQKAKIVQGNDLLDVVEPLTLELLGEKAVYVKQNTVFAQAETPKPKEEPKPSKPTPKKKMEPSDGAPVPDFDYSKEYQDICKKVETGIETASHTPNPKLEKQLTAGKVPGQVMLGGGMTATLSETGVLSIEGSGEMRPSDKKVLMMQMKEVKAIVVGEGITKVSALNGMLFISKVEYVKLPSTLEVIDDECFSGCSKLLAVNIPSKVNRIGKKAFNGCSKLFSIALPDGIESIGAEAFSGCESLGLVVLPDAVTVIPDELFHGCKNLREIYLSSKTTSIGKKAFSRCESVQKLYLPNNVVSIGEECFYNMKSLYDIHLSDKLAMIPNKAFDGCKSLAKITCPANVRSVGESAFEDCDNLVEVVFLSEDMTSIGKDCFNDCNSLGKIVLYSLRPPKVKDEIFDDDFQEKVILSVQPAVHGVYKKADYWEDFKIITTINK